MANYYPTEIVRGIILGKIKYRKCPMCEGTAMQNWDEYGEDIKSGPSCSENRTTGECDNCDGLGFILSK